MADGVESPGSRLYDIRLACGDGRRDPMPLARFSALVKEKTGVYYDPATLSLLERMKQGWRWEDVDVLARVDPRERGRVWLSAFDARDQQPEAELPWGAVRSVTTTESLTPSRPDYTHPKIGGVVLPRSKGDKAVKKGKDRDGTDKKHRRTGS